MLSHSDQVKRYLLQLQKNICDAVSSIDATVHCVVDDWQRDNDGGEGRTCAFQNGDIIEKAGVNFSHVKGNHLPPAATLKKPELEGAHFEALGVSVIIHPRNPFAPTSHLNVRYFQAINPQGQCVWWFGGGYDLTPYYGFDDDCRHWHQTAKRACDAIDPQLYAQYKKAADDYFYLKHRNECRGIGGIFFDDVQRGTFEESFALMQSVGNSYIDAYFPIVNKRYAHAYDESHRAFQLMRRGRYVEFNLVFDRGTLFGLQFGGRIESILISLPPAVTWEYQAVYPKGSAEDKLTSYYLIPREWIA